MDLDAPSPTLAFIGGGNMAAALIGGLLKAGRPARSIGVVEPGAERAAQLRADCGVTVWDAAGPQLAGAAVVAWAVKPQVFAAAAAPCAPYIGGALQLSIMAGVRCDTIEHATGSARIVRTMPNTPALIGQGMTGLYATPQASPADRDAAAAVLQATGQLLWVQREADLDAVTALSGSGPAYVFYFIEAMVQAGVELGLTAEQSRTLALGTFTGASALAAQSGDAPAVLRQRVTSPGGTTHAAIESMQAAGVQAAFVRAMHAAAQRAVELGKA